MTQASSGFINPFLKQIRQVWTVLSVPQRVTLAMFTAGSMVLLALVGFWSSRPDYVPVVSNLTPEEVTTASAKLRDAQIPFRYEASRGVIAVPSGKVEDARLELAELGFSAAGAKGRDGFELFDSQSFGVTDFAQRVNYLRSLQGSLERKIAALDGIEVAHVTLTLPREELFVRDQQPPKASVEVKARRGYDLGPSQVMAIRHIVSAAVPKLMPAHVAVMDGEGRMLARFEDASGQGTLSGDKLEARIKIEGYIRGKVETLLHQALGSDRAAVQVAVDMSFEAVERRVQRMDPDSAVVLQEQITNNEASGGGENADKHTAQSSQSKKQKTVNNSYHYDTFTETVRPEVGKLERIAVAVLVRPKVVDDGGANKFIPLAEAELISLTEAVKRAVGFNAARKDEVKIENAPEPDPAMLAAYSSVPSPDPAPSPAGDLARQLPNLAAVLGVIVLGIVLWRTMRKLSIQSANFSATIDAETPMAIGSGSRTVGQATPPQNAVHDLIGKNPAQATNLIRAMLQK